MPEFAHQKFDVARCRKEIEELRQYLDGSSDFTERQLKNFFRSRTYLCAIISSYNRDMNDYNLVAWEDPLFGDFRCDLAIGDSVKHAYTFIEFEDAKPNSLFRRHGAKTTTEWSPRFECGFSQVVDWFYKIHAMTNTPDMETRLGKRAIEYMGVVVAGREQHLQAGERLRLEWRRKHIVVNSRRIECVTYDELLNDVDYRLRKYELAT